MHKTAKAVTSPFTSSIVRKTFLDFFCLEKGHAWVRSSPVLPHGDPTLAFVNAGMNQFKGVLQGSVRAPHARIANSQKCVRVGGKHNDLALVGADSSHLTFFEMLGNWSFADYFKEEACSMSWELLVDGYQLDPKCLHVTYFGGDATLGLSPDLLTRDIWLNIGVPASHIEAKGVTDNFWEMGTNGPCGACTEIHYLPHGQQPENLLEIWNLVFVEYNREVDGTLRKLGVKHVDTGMGLERLTAVLQGCSSNYQTDLFLPFFQAIQKTCGCPPYQELYGHQDTNRLNTAYRILADHARMITVCLADGFFPDQEGKLRGMIRKALSICEDVFHKDVSLLQELSMVVAETLSEAYPELVRNMPRVHHILKEEAQLLLSLQKSKFGEWESLCKTDTLLANLPIRECPNLLPAFQRLKTQVKRGQKIEADVAWKACETFGVPQHLADSLAQALGCSLDSDELEMEVARCKMESRQAMYKGQENEGLPSSWVEQLRSKGVSETDDNAKYQYRHTFSEKGYPQFPPIPSKIVGLIVNNNLVEKITDEIVSDEEMGVILDRTNFYTEAGGQASDTGTVTLQSGHELTVHKVNLVGGYIVHWVPIHKDVRVLDHCCVRIDSERRTGLMNNHTATHLLNAALRERLTLTEQKSSRVQPHKLTFDFSVYRQTLNSNDIRNIEETVSYIIKGGVGIKRQIVSNSALSNVHPLTVLPGETYLAPQISLIQINNGYFLSREPCCGTHAVDTSHLQDFLITSFKSLSSCVKSIVAVTGKEAKRARQNADTFQTQLQLLQDDVKQVLDCTPRDEAKVEESDVKLGDFLRNVRNTKLLSQLVKEELNHTVTGLRTLLKSNARHSLRSSIEDEMQEVVKVNEKPYLIHVLRSSSNLDSAPLQKASRICPHLPSLLFTTSASQVKARCQIPQTDVTDNFTAELWMKSVLSAVQATGGPPRGQDPKLVYNMKAKKLNESQLMDAVEAATKFANENIKKS